MAYALNIAQIQTVKEQIHPELVAKASLLTDSMFEELGMKVMRYYYQYDVDYIALDANGIGQAVLDYLMDDHYDTEYGVTYRALNCCNNDDLAIRCRVKNAPKVIAALKAIAEAEAY